ncbi:unnamed protein product [Amoebophrya sp. A25]|nr:unnamed protein product [Amoebophrya sp. A25]|eukprot:GSA25T00015776001.1
MTSLHPDEAMGLRQRGAQKIAKDDVARGPDATITGVKIDLQRQQEDVEGKNVLLSLGAEAEGSEENSPTPSMLMNKEAFRARRLKSVLEEEFFIDNSVSPNGGSVKATLPMNKPALDDEKEVRTFTATFLRSERHFTVKKRVLYGLLITAAVIDLDVAYMLFGRFGCACAAIWTTYLGVWLWPGKVGQWSGNDRLQVRAILLFFLTALNTILTFSFWLVFCADRWLLRFLTLAMTISTPQEAEATSQSIVNFVGPMRLCFFGYVSWIFFIDHGASTGWFEAKKSGEDMPKDIFNDHEASVAEPQVDSPFISGGTNKLQNKNLNCNDEPGGRRLQFRRGRGAARADQERKLADDVEVDDENQNDLDIEDQDSSQLTVDGYEDLEEEEDRREQLRYMLSTGGNGSSVDEWIAEGDSDCRGDIEGLSTAAPSSENSPLTDTPSDAASVVLAKKPRSREILGTSRGRTFLRTEEEKDPPAEAGVEGKVGTSTSPSATTSCTRSSSSSPSSSTAARRVSSRRGSISASVVSVASDVSSVSSKESGGPESANTIVGGSVRTAWSLFCYVLSEIWSRVFHPRKYDRHCPSCRRRRVYRHAAMYFPVKLTRTCKLDPSKAYMFGYHPHGILSVGALLNFSTFATGFDLLFPGIDVRLLTMKINFQIPFWREFLLALGLQDVSAQSITNNLRRGKSVALVPGGAKESLESDIGNNVLILENRKGFVKYALKNGASLVPVYSFGETDLYQTVELTGRAKEWQDWLQKKMGFALPLIAGRSLTGGIFYKLFGFKKGLFPFRTPVHSVVGKPIPCPRTPEPSQEMINLYHEKYTAELQRIYKEWAPIYEDAKQLRFEEMERNAARRNLLKQHPGTKKLTQVASEMKIK